MKIRYFLMGAALVAMASVSFTACSDDDEDAPEMTATPELTLKEDADAMRVKIGTENRQTLPVETGAGEYNAYSMNPAIADITYDEAGNAYVEGFGNGSTQIVVSDAANRYKRFNVSVYTTDVMQLSHTEYEFQTPLGLSSTSNQCHVTAGNGHYSIESDNEKVVAVINEETGEISLTATSGKEEFVAVVTVTDCTGLTATINVTVKYTLDAFTDADIQNLASKSGRELYIKSSKFSMNTNSDGGSSWGWNYGEVTDSDNADGTHTFGWWEPAYGDYGGHYIIYPQGTALNQDVAATYRFKYSAYYDTWNLEGTARILRDDDVAKVMIWWSVDMENECIDRGWIVIPRSDL